MNWSLCLLEKNPSRLVKNHPRKEKTLSRLVKNHPRKEKTLSHLAKNHPRKEKTLSHLAKNHPCREMSLCNQPLSRNGRLRVKPEALKPACLQVRRTKRGSWSVQSCWPRLRLTKHRCP